MALLLLVMFWASVWPYLLGFLLVAVAGTIGWWLWRTDRLLRGRDRRRRQEDAVQAGRRTSPRRTS